MKADLSKVRFRDDEINAVANAAAIIDAIEEQTSERDEEPGFDLDDAIAVAMEHNTGGLELWRFIAEGSTPRAKAARFVAIAAGLERAYGVIDDTDDQPAG